MNFSCSCLTGFKSDSMDVMINELSVCLFVGDVFTVPVNHP